MEGAEEKTFFLKMKQDAETAAISQQKTETTGPQTITLMEKMDMDKAKAESLSQGAEVNTEDLGLQTMEGVMATGTRTTKTIPAGRIGNEKPISIVMVLPR